MLNDLNRVDFTNVQEQASWVCGCDLGTVTRLEESFKATLQQQASLESWAGWLEGVAESILRYLNASLVAFGSCIYRGILN